MRVGFQAGRGKLDSGRISAPRIQGLVGLSLGDDSSSYLTPHALRLYPTGRDLLYTSCKLRAAVEIHAQYNEALIGIATKRFWVRFIGWHGFLVVGILAAYVAYLLVVEGASAIAIGLSGVLGLATFVGSAVYFVYRNRALATFRRMGKPEAMFSLGPEGISSRSDLGGGDLKWRGITQVWVFPEVWLLFVSKGVYFTIPTDSMTPDAQSFIREKVEEHGGRVV